MEINELIASIEKEQERAKQEISSNEGLLRLQEVAAKYDGEYKLVWSHALLQELADRPKIIAHPTGLKDLDNLIGGVRDQQVITISAHSKHGKTSFGMFMLHALESLNPVMVALEQSNVELIEQRTENGYTVPNFLSPAMLPAKVDVDWIEQRIIEGIAKYNTKLVLIDHLGYIDNNGPGGINRRENLAYRVGEVMRSLKAIAKRWNVCILLLVHISQSDEGKPPTLEDLKNSSDILQESDMVMMLWRKNIREGKVRIYEDKTMISVLANRRTGKNGNVGLKFNRETGLYESDNEWVEAMEAKAKSMLEDNDDF